MPYLREIWHFKSKKLLHQGYSTILNIELYCSQYCKKKKKYIYIYIYIFYSYFTRNFSLIPLIFSVLFSLFLLCFSICSFLSKASSPKFLTHLTWPLSHLSSHGLSLSASVLGFGFLRLEVGLAWISELGLDRWAGIS